MTAIVIIPARYQSARFPGKLLCPLKGKPIIQHVYENAKKAILPDDVIIATDSETVFEKVSVFGGKAAMTDKKHPSGTDRIAEVAASLDCDIIVNVQGDEPLIRPEMIDEVISLLDDTRASMGTLAKKIREAQEIMDPNVVKVVFTSEGFALYFSRSPIPFLASHSEHKAAYSCYKHIGIYSYRRDALLTLTRMSPSCLEQTEKLEQLRALEHGMRIRVKETFFETHGVDTPQDLERVEQWLNTSL
ncbi:MAG: 3-deoxy-manno-octulosonate cytidylyltransferase [Nitrospirota bacterium]